MENTDAPSSNVVDPGSFDRDFRSSIASYVLTLLGSRIDSILLFGSRARQQAEEHSDWDVAVILKYTLDIGRDFRRLILISKSIRKSTGKNVHFVAMTREQLDAEGAFEENLLREAIPL